MIKIGIDPSATGVTGIVVFENNKLIRKEEYYRKDWKCHVNCIIEIIWEYQDEIINIENCLYTNANASKDRDDLLRLLGAIEKWYFDIINWVSPRHTKSVVKNMENLSKYRKITAIYGEDNLLTYEHHKGWFYNNEKISNHLRDAIIIANYER
ncbi:hypothetical protein GL981_12800 (plasmid) [Spiroplasma citri]|uniref:Uncharacterized protein n=1 Tax=Spiroplasma citri TaxID=2133 RepID=A0AAJ4EL64_SPICI|nr:hypothetical protein [Spiroplasma citri]QIA69872.1 hypothetical protein GL298_10615 [Spiroplasma citri]QIA71457.1 hypothetical protein GL981_09115 [Spiroplasma citri]QIA72145.1 hypothetical protein GL981_12800 [Spiroplasma citri]